MSADLLGPGDDRYGFTGRDPQNNPIDVHLLSAEPGELWGGGNVRLDARITNHGAAPIRNLMIKADWASADNVPEPRVLDQPKYVDLAPGTSVEYVGRIKVSQGASYSLGVVAIAPDSTASWSLKSVQVVDIGFVVMAMALVSKSVVVLMGSFDPRGLVWLVVFPALAALVLIPVSYLVLTVSRAVDGSSQSPKFANRTLAASMQRNLHIMLAVPSGGLFYVLMYLGARATAVSRSAPVPPDLLVHLENVWLAVAAVATGRRFFERLPRSWGLLSFALSFGVVSALAALAAGIP